MTATTTVYIAAIEGNDPYTTQGPGPFSVVRQRNCTLVVSPKNFTLYRWDRPVMAVGLDITAKHEAAHSALMLEDGKDPYPMKYPEAIYMTVGFPLMRFEPVLDNPPAI